MKREARDHSCLAVWIDMENREDNRIEEFKGTYYYNDIIVFASNAGELLLVACAILIYYGAIKRELELIEILFFIVAGLFALYFNVCYFKIMKNNRIHMSITDEEITVYRVFRLRPIRIKANETEEIQMRKSKNGKFFLIKTNRRKYYVRNIRSSESKEH